MNKEIDLTRSWILMRNGMAYSITNETAKVLQIELDRQTAHRFILIKELGTSKNTADISEIMDALQYAEYVNIKQGMWKCMYMNWHKKKGECECKKNIDQELKNIRQQKEIEDMNRALTPEEKEQNKKRCAEIGEHLKELGLSKKV